MLPYTHRYQRKLLQHISSTGTYFFIFELWLRGEDAGFHPGLPFSLSEDLSSHLSVKSTSHFSSSQNLFKVRINLNGF